MIEVWDLWFPNAGATGLSFARCRVGAAAADRARLRVTHCPGPPDLGGRSLASHMVFTC